MKKIQLNLDDLKIESFDTTPADGEGAVQGYSCPTCGANTCTCGATCPYTCPQTCETCPATDCSCPIRSCPTVICQ